MKLLPRPQPAPARPLQLENVPARGKWSPQRQAVVQLSAPASSARVKAALARRRAQSGPPTSNHAAWPVAAGYAGRCGSRGRGAGVPGAQNPGGLKTVGPTNNEPLPPVEKPAEAPAQTNDVHEQPPRCRPAPMPAPRNGRRRTQGAQVNQATSLRANTRKRRGSTSSTRSRSSCLRG